MKSFTVTIQTKAVEQNFPVMLFIFKMMVAGGSITHESVNEILKINVLLLK